MNKYVASCRTVGAYRRPLPFVAGALLLIVGVSTVRSQNSQTHDLKLSPATVHWGYYDATVKPVLRVASGDTIRVETMVARGLQRFRAVGVSEQEIPESLKTVEDAVKERGPRSEEHTSELQSRGLISY